MMYTGMMAWECKRATFLLQKLAQKGHMSFLAVFLFLLLEALSSHSPSHIRFRLGVTKLDVLTSSLIVTEPFFSQFGVSKLQSLNNADVSSTFVVMDALSACALKCSIKTIPRARSILTSNFSARSLQPAFSALLTTNSFKPIRKSSSDSEREESHSTS